MTRFYSTNNFSNFTGVYCFGFNGKESDTSTSADSYDFGARILDARIGRWLSVDKATQTQPQWSTYKAFKDCPLLFTDPDGNAEFLTIVFKDQHGNSMKYRVLKSENVMTDGVVCRTKIYLFGNPWGEHHTYNYYDFETTITYTIDDNGKLLSTESHTDILYQNGVKDEDFVLTFGTPVKPGDTKDPDGFNNPDSQECGLHLTSEEGGSDPVKNKNKGSRSVDIGDFLTAISGFMKDPANVPEIQGALGPGEYLGLITELHGEREKLAPPSVGGTKVKNPEPGDSVIISSTRVTNHESTYNGRVITTQSHSTGPDVKGVVPKDTTGGIVKGDKNLLVNKVQPLKK